MSAAGKMGCSSFALNAAAPERYGFDIATFKPQNVRGVLTEEAKETMRLQAARQAMKVPLYQVYVTDENNEPKPVGPKIAHRVAEAFCRTIEIAIKTGQISGWKLPRLELAVQPNTGLGLCRGSDSIIQGV